MASVRALLLCPLLQTGLATPRPTPQRPLFLSLVAFASPSHVLRGFAGSASQPCPLAKLTLSAALHSLSSALSLRA